MKLARYTKGNECFLCPRHCIINERKRGFCKTRINIDGKIYFEGIDVTDMSQQELTVLYEKTNRDAVNYLRKITG